MTMVGTSVNFTHKVATAGSFKKATSLRSRWADIAASDGEDEEVESPRSATSSALLSVEEARPCTWNLEAPDFIPTLTMPCPVVTVCSVVQEALAPRLARATTDSIAYSASKRSEFASRPDSNRKASRPKRPPMRIGSSPAVLSTSARFDASEALSQRCEGDGEALSEELFEKRTFQRQKDIALVKATLECQWHEDSKQDAGEPLVAPDPTDRSISKRQWKYHVGCWRNSLCHRYQEHLSEVQSVVGSVASAEDCQSTCDTTTSAGSTRGSGREIDFYEDDTPCARSAWGSEDTTSVH